jgi:protein involved in temperature-dependent protein secretion
MLRAHTFDPNEPVVIRTYRYAYEAELARAVLEAAGIPCMLSADSYAEAAGLPVRLAVRRDHAADAAAALDAPTPLDEAELDAAAFDDAEPPDDAPAG